jgi:hypothetical protein
VLPISEHSQDSVTIDLSLLYSNSSNVLKMLYIMVKSVLV